MYSSKSRKASLSIMCRFFCDNLDHTEAEDAIFLTVLDRALEDSRLTEDDGLILVLLENTSDLFKPTRSNVSLLISPYLDALAWLINRDNALVVTKLWDVCRILGDIYLLSNILPNSPAKMSVVNVIGELYHRVICKNETDLVGPFLCMISNLIIQSPQNEDRDFLLGYLLDGIVPKDGGIINYLAIEAVEAISFIIDSYPNGKRITIQRIMLAIRSCMLPVPGGDNRKQDAVGGRLIASLGHFVKSSDEPDLKRGVWELMDDCENATTSGSGASYMRNAAKYLKAYILNYNNNRCVGKHRANGLGIAYHQKIRSILSFSDDSNSMISRTMAGSFPYDIRCEGFGGRNLDNIGVVFESAIAIPEVEPYVRDNIGDDSDDLVQEAIDWVSTEYPLSCQAESIEFVPTEFDQQVKNQLVNFRCEKLLNRLIGFIMKSSWLPIIIDSLSYLVLMSSTSNRRGGKVQILCICY